ncbi:hypothetical protein ACLKA6_018335 [Drosophila palustris]
MLSTARHGKCLAWRRNHLSSSSSNRSTESGSKEAPKCPVRGFIKDHQEILMSTSHQLWRPRWQVTGDAPSCHACHIPDLVDSLRI